MENPRKDVLLALGSMFVGLAAIAVAVYDHWGLSLVMMSFSVYLISKTN